MEYTLTKKEVEKLLGKSPKTISRYIKSKKLNPIKQKNSKGHLSYMFNKEEVDTIGQGTQQETNEGTFYTGEDKAKSDSTNNLNNETGGTKRGSKDKTGDTAGDIVGLLKEQINVKDEQIKNLTMSLQWEQQEKAKLINLLGAPKDIGDITGDIVDTVEDITGDKEKTKPEEKSKKESGDKRQKGLFSWLFGK
jgi:hypothetical protein